MAVVWILMWALTSVGAYFLAEAACICCGRGLWDKPTKEFVAICSILFGPVFLVISAELLLLAAMGSGLAKGNHKTYRN